MGVRRFNMQVRCEHGLRFFELWWSTHFLIFFQIFRAIDPGLSRMFYNMQCDTSLLPAEYNHCVSEQAQRYGSKEQLAKKILLNTIKSWGSIFRVSRIEVHF
jgi:hypothetical protein